MAPSAISSQLTVERLALPCMWNNVCMLSVCVCCRCPLGVFLCTVCVCVCLCHWGWEGLEGEVTQRQQQSSSVKSSWPEWHSHSCAPVLTLCCCCRLSAFCLRLLASGLCTYWLLYSTCAEIFMHCELSGQNVWVNKKWNRSRATFCLLHMIFISKQHIFTFFASPSHCQDLFYQQCAKIITQASYTPKMSASSQIISGKEAS